MDFNDQNKLIPFTNNSLIRAKNSISVVNKIMKEISLNKFDKWDWWNNLSDEWKLILFYEGEIKNYGDHSIQNFNIEINESDLNRILEMKSLILGIFIEYIHGYDSKRYVEWKNWSLSDINPLNHLEKLTNLYLSGQEILNLIPSTNKINITHLYVGGEISDVSPIKDFLNLKYLSLDLRLYKGRPIDRSIRSIFKTALDLNPLSKLKNLTGLDLSNNHKSDLSPLSNLINLNKLKLNDNHISDLSILSNLINLKILHLNDNVISSLSPLSFLRNLTELNLEENQIFKLSPLSFLKNLNHLNLFDNKISDISPLNNLTKLTKIFMGENKISDLSPLSNLTNLTELDLFNNQISDLSPLSNLINLTELELSGNQISDLSPLSELTNLTELKLEDNQISDLTSLSNLINLTCLELSGNQISDLSPLSKLTNLIELKLEDNQILDASPLSNLTNLTDLYIGKCDYLNEDSTKKLKIILPNCNINTY